MDALDTLIREQRTWLHDFGPGAARNKRHGAMSVEQHQHKLNALLWARRGYATALERKAAAE
ncbi:hypothetical protein CSC94_12645 [Zhengella mangrovi]|uniref:Uncharacterized protein n=1 Tax=Zhengella mangrovi TaxID=1982044 RepID=A0A2G1QM34_9HYPH|nr:hypothetical protein CSC94_12645 [Zhengella mangrovi]